MKKLILVMVFCVCLMSGCALRDTLDSRGIMEYKIDTADCNYNNGLYAFKYDESKLDVGEVMNWGDSTIGSVDVISDSVITGDSLVGVYVEYNAPNTEDTIVDYTKKWVKTGFHIDEMSDIQSTAYTDKNFAVADITFSSNDKDYIIKAYSKWGLTYICVAELVEDKGNNEYIKEVCETFKAVGTQVDDKYVFNIDDLDTSFEE